MLNDNPLRVVLSRLAAYDCTGGILITVKRRKL